MRKILLIFKFLLLIVTFLNLSSQAMHKDPQQELPKAPAKGLKVLELWKAEIQDHWPPSILAKKEKEALALFLQKKQNEALGLLQEGVLRGHCEFMKLLGQHFRRNGDYTEALNWLVLAHQREFFTTFKDNNTYFTVLENTPAQRQAANYLKSFVNSHASKHLTPNSGEQIRRRNYGIIGLSADLTSSTTKNPVMNFSDEPWLTKQERFAKAWWIMRLIPNKELDAESLSELYRLVSSENLRELISPNKCERLKWAYFTEFCKRFLQNLNPTNTIDEQKCRPLFLTLEDTNFLDLIPIADYLLWIKNCFTGLERAKPKEYQTYQNACLTKMEKVVAQSNLTTSEFEALLRLLKKQNYPQEFQAYIEGLLYKYNKMGQSLTIYHQNGRACDLLIKAGFIYPLVDWFRTVNSDCPPAESCIIIRKIINFDSSFSTSPADSIIGCYIREISSLLEQLDLPSPPELHQHCRNLMSEAHQFFQKKREEFLLQDTFILGTLYSIAPYILDLSPEQKTKLFSQSNEILQLASAHGNPLGHALLAFNYLNIILSNQKAENNYDQAVFSLKELGLTSPPPTFERFLENIRKEFSEAQNDGEVLYNFLDLMCGYIADNFDNFECLPPEIKKTIDEKQTSEPPLETEDSPNKITNPTLMNSSIEEITVERESKDKRMDTMLEASSLSSKSPEGKTDSPSLPSSTPPSKTHLNPKIKTIKKLNSKQELLKRIIYTKAQKVTEPPAEYTICFISEKVKKDFEGYESDSNFEKVFKEVVKAIKAGPFGYRDPRGRPKLLSGDYRGYFSRHLSEKDRIVYKYNTNKTVTIIEVGGHYQRSR